MCQWLSKRTTSRASFGSKQRGGFTTKIHVLVDALGLPMKFILMPGQNSEIKQAPELIKDLKDANILGDKVFDSDEFIDQILSQNCTPIIPPRENRKIKKEVDYHSTKIIAFLVHT
ncbi:MAG: transposase [Alphaproteobacteria bacterium]|nr:transposase [Alphaproteobacteria bacterium]